MNAIKRDTYAVTGYIHENYIEKSRSVPEDIIGLCYKYYHEIIQTLPGFKGEEDTIQNYPLSAINDKEIIIIPEANWFCRTKGIYKYNIETKQYELFIEYKSEPIYYAPFLSSIKMEGKT